MLVCPQCQFENPDTHKFCQKCGFSLTHQHCSQCGATVPLDVLNCENCGAQTGKVWLAVVSWHSDTPASSSLETASDWADTQTVVREASPQENHLAGGGASDRDSTPPALDAIGTDSDAERVAIASSPAKNGDETVGGNISPWADEEEVGLAEVFDPGDLSDIDALSSETADVEADRPPDDRVTPKPQPASIPKGAYLDPQQRYQLLESLPPLVSGTIATVRVLDCRSLQLSPLDTRELGAFDSLPEQMEPFVIPLAQAYLMLKSQYPQHFPNPHDTWEQNNRAIVLLEDYSHFPDFAGRWDDIRTEPRQIVTWLQEMAGLWGALEPWQCRQSLLELDNIVVSEVPPATLCLKRLYPDPAEAPTLEDLGELWTALFRRSQRTLMGSLTELLRHLREGKIEGVEALQERLEQIQMELAPTAEPPEAIAAPISGGVTRLQVDAEPTKLDGMAEAPTVPRPPQLFNLEAFGRTDVGRERSHNEDDFGIQTLLDRQETAGSRTLAARGLYILCDGMGGHAGGEVASRMAVSTLKQYFHTHWTDSLPSEAMIRDAIAQTNQTLYRLNLEGTRSGSGRMGTTLVLAVVADTRLAVAHVGDSRLYRFNRSRGLEQVTVDHEVGQREIARGVDAELAYTRPDAYQLTQAIGPRDGNYLKPDIRFFEVLEDTVLILASDGLTDNNLLETHLKTHVEPLIRPDVDLETGVDALIDLANEYNGHDNITAIAVRALVQHGS
ncbi:MAG: serine/threonine phosphatase [Limnospira sp.]